LLHWRAVAAEVTGDEAASAPAGGEASMAWPPATLRRLADERLHAQAAEANFRRAACGASVVALRHAALALRLFGRRKAVQREDELRAVRTPEVQDLTMSKEEVAKRLKNAEELVAFRAAAAIESRRIAAEKEAEAQAGRRHISGVGMVGTASGTSPRDGGLTDVPAGKLSSLQRGLQAYREFVDFAIRRYGNACRLWFAIDPEENMEIGEMQFARACEGIGYRGNLAALWRYLDLDHSGHITLQEVDSSCAVLLAGLKLFLEEKFSGRWPAATTALIGRSNRAHKADFVARLEELGYQGPARKLFDFLARSGLGFVLRTDLSFLQSWTPPSYLVCKPDVEFLEEVKSALLALHGNLLRAWMRDLDKSRTMRVTWEDWLHMCNSLVQKTAAGAALPKTERQQAAAWRALDKDCSGWIPLRVLDFEAFSCLAVVKRWVDSAHAGLVSRALRSMAAPRTESDQILEGHRPPLVPVSTIQVTRKAFKHVLRRDVGMSREDAELFCIGLDLRDDRMLTESDFKFIERWDLNWEDWVASSGRSCGIPQAKRSSAVSMHSNVESHSGQRH